MVHSLRIKACFYFAAGFSLLWIICNTVLYIEFYQALWNNFDSLMRQKASLIAKSAGINPRIVPLPEEGDHLLMFYTDNYGTIDTLFIPPSDILNRLMTERHVSVEEEKESGILTIVYSMPSDKVAASMRKITFIFAAAFLVEILLAILLGYWLSWKLIRPIRRIINLADITDLKNNTQLLYEPDTEEELRKLTASFNRMLARIKEQSDLQNTFFASASHELRTPLSVMQTRLQVLLSEGLLKDEAKQAFQEQLAEVKRMISMANDFLLMSEILNGNMEIIKTECNLSDILTTLISQHKQKALERGLNFKISFYPDNDVFSVMADEIKLAAILNNLLVNAVKYSQENSTIDICLKKTETYPLTIRIKNKIRNGINPDITAIKHSFYHSKPLHAEGSGLGLWIANRLAELNGFTMNVTICDEIFEVSIIEAKQTHLNTNVSRSSEFVIRMI